MKFRTSPYGEDVLTFFSPLNLFLSNLEPIIEQVQHFKGNKPMKVSILLSSAALLTAFFIQEANAQLKIPSLGQCYAQADDKFSREHCDALKDCVDNKSDDQASLTGCIDEAEDAYVAKSLEEENGEIGMNPEETGSARSAEQIRTNTLKANSDLVESIQGNKGFTQQQEGPM